MSAGADAAATAIVRPYPLDIALGDPKARVTLIEYASLTCGHCALFHETVYPEIKRRFVDTGKMLFVLRHYPTAPREIALAGALVARCGKPSAAVYYQRIGVWFDQQDAIFDALRQGQARGALEQFAAGQGIAPAQMDQCLKDQATLKRLNDTADAGEKAFDISGTPTLVLNGEKLTAAADYTVEGLSKRIEALLAKAR